MSHSFRTVASVFFAVLALAATSYAAPAKAPKSHSVVGTLLKVDGQNITVQTTQGAETVALVSTSRIQSGAATIQVANLSSYAGQPIKVRYVDRNGAKEVETVTLSSAPKAATASKPAAKSTAK